MEVEDRITKIEISEVYDQIWKDLVYWPLGRSTIALIRGVLNLWSNTIHKVYQGLDLKRVYTIIDLVQIYGVFWLIYVYVDWGFRDSKKVDFNLVEQTNFISLVSIKLYGVVWPEISLRRVDEAILIDFYWTYICMLNLGGF